MEIRVLWVALQMVPHQTTAEGTIQTLGTPSRLVSGSRRHSLPLVKVQSGVDTVNIQSVSTKRTLITAVVSTDPVHVVVSCQRLLPATREWTLLAGE